MGEQLIQESLSVRLYYVTWVSKTLKEGLNQAWHLIFPVSRRTINVLITIITPIDLLLGLI